MDKGFTSVGFEKKRYEDILSDLHTRARQEFGEGVNVNDNSPLGKFLKVIAWHSAEMWEVYERGYYQNYLLTSEGVGLDMWATNFGEMRRLGSKATGDITITGTPGLRVPRGFRVSAGTELIFETTESKSLDESGRANINIQSIEVGSEYNLLENMIKNIVNPIIGITSVVNNKPTTGGIGVETDEELRERLVFKIRTTMTGDNKNQYIYWAKQNEKVGTARVQRATPMPGYVTVKIATADGDKADEELIKEVYDYIKPLQPTTAGLVVETLDTVDVIVKISGLKLRNNVSQEQIKLQLSNNIGRYFATEATQSGEVSIAKVSYMVMGHPDIADFSQLSINGQTSNLILATDEIPVLQDIELEVI